MITHWYYPGISSIMWVENLNIKMFQELLTGIGILVANKCVKYTRIDSTYDHLVWLTVTTEYYQKNIKIGCAYIPPENSTCVGLRNDFLLC